MGGPFLIDICKGKVTPFPQGALLAQCFPAAVPGLLAQALGYGSL